MIIVLYLNLTVWVWLCWIKLHKDELEITTIIICIIHKKCELFQTQHYILVAQAQDNGHPSLSGTVTVYVNVIDLNDNAPIFDPMSFSNEILEDVPIGSSVVTISATDLDSGL